jgi:hypothetical protein
MNAHIMKKELERPQNLTGPVEGDLIFDDLIVYGLGYYNGYPIYDKPCLMVQLGNWVSLSDMAYDVLSTCLGFFTQYSDYDTLIYAYETTSDALGMGMTLPAGWYAANSKTLAVTPFNIEECPLFFDIDGIMKLAEEKGWVIDDYFYEIAPLTKDYSFTITEQHVRGFVEVNGESVSSQICKSSLGESFAFADYGLTEEQALKISLNKYTAFTAGYKAANTDEQNLYGFYYDATVEYEAINQIDPKFIPDTLIPTKTSQLDNDSDYTTKEYVNKLIEETIGSVIGGSY